MRNEIAEQPQRWSELVASQRDALIMAGRWIASEDYDSLIFVARGTSDHAALYGQYLYQLEIGRPAYLAAPSVASVFGRNVFTPRNLVVAISQSGASPDLLATLQGASDSGARVIAITNSPDSAMATMADLHIALSAGPELSVAATKTYTAELISLFACVKLAAGWSMDEVESAVSVLAHYGGQLLGSFQPAVTSVAARFCDAERVLVIGRGLSMSSAKETALKLMETCRIAASGWSAADAKHGPIGQIVEGTPVILFTSSAIGAESVIALRPLLISLGAKLYAVGGIRHDAQSEKLIADLRLQPIDDALLPVLEILPIQLIALELSLARGLDPDSPAGLLKVTVTT